MLTEADHAYWVKRLTYANVVLSGVAGSSIQAVYSSEDDLKSYEQSWALYITIAISQLFNVIITCLSWRLEPSSREFLELVNDINKKLQIIQTKFPQAHASYQAVLTSYLGDVAQGQALVLDDRLNRMLNRYKCADYIKIAFSILSLIFIILGFVFYEAKVLPKTNTYLIFFVCMAIGMVLYGICDLFQTMIHGHYKDEAYHKLKILKRKISESEAYLYQKQVYVVAGGEPSRIEKKMRRAVSEYKKNAGDLLGKDAFKNNEIYKSFKDKEREILNLLKDVHNNNQMLTHLHFKPFRQKIKELSQLDTSNAENCLAALGQFTTLYTETVDNFVAMVDTPLGENTRNRLREMSITYNTTPGRWIAEHL